MFSPNLQPNFEAEFAEFISSHQFSTIEDHYQELLKELFHVLNPQLEEGSADAQQKLTQYLSEQRGGQADFNFQGTWVFYPWTNKLIHFLPNETHQKIRTARNKFLLTDEEQQKFQNYVVAIAGLSIGNSVALSLAYSGGCQTMKLADPDIFAATNLNRVRVPVQYLGLKKVYVAAQQIYELNPYANLILYPEGVTEENLSDFLTGDPKPAIVVDEMDNLKLKIFIRLAARAAKLPVVMTTDNGDNAIIDVDRFDLGDDSMLKDLPQMDLSTVISGMSVGEKLDLKIRERVKFSTNLVGAKNATPRMQESLMQVDRQIPSWPQLGIAAFLGGASLAYVIKKMSVGEQILSGKYHLKLDQTFLGDYDSESNLAQREQKTTELLSYINKPNFINKPNYQVWETNEKDYPQNGILEEKLKFILNYALMAPSSHNTQPWKFSIKDHQIELHANFARSLAVSDPTHREFYISLGACLANLLVALSHFGFATQVDFPHDNLVAVIKIQENGSIDQNLATLFPQIIKRGSNRTLYEEKNISEDLLNNLKNFRQNGVEVNFITESELKEKIVELVGEGSKLIMSNQPFREELSTWLRHNFSRQRDGMPGSNFGMNDIQSILGPFLIKNYDLGADQQKQDQVAVKSAPVLVVISSNQDNPKGWVEVGELYEKLTLKATEFGLSYATLASVVELSDLYRRLMAILGISTRPQIFFRLGYAKKAIERSPRLNVDEVLI